MSVSHPVGQSVSLSVYLKLYFLDVFCSVEILHIAHWKVQAVVGSKVLEVVVVRESVLREENGRVR